MLKKMGCKGISVLRPEKVSSSPHKSLFGNLHPPEKKHKTKANPTDLETEGTLCGKKKKQQLSNLIKLFNFVHLKATEDVDQYILILKKIQ